MPVKRETYRKNPLVPIRGDLLKALIRRAGYTVMGFAKEVGEDQRTLDSIVRGQVKRCRKSRRDRLAKKFGVPPEWLGGEQRYLGYASYFVGDEPDVPAAWQFAQHRLAEQCVQAWWRDMVAAHPELANTAAEDRERMIMRLPWHLFYGLLVGEVWRSQLLTDRPTGCAQTLSAENRDEFTTCLVTALKCLLQPWFDGEAQLEYRMIREWIERTETRYERVVLADGRFLFSLRPITRDPSESKPELILVEPERTPQEQGDTGGGGRL